MGNRNLYLDNLKFLLINLVVLGHFYLTCHESQIAFALRNVIYSFHMPLFIFVSGYLSKHIIHQRKKEYDMILFTYFMFEIINLIYTKLTPYHFGSGSINIFEPTFQNWYLLALFFWRTFAPYYRFFSSRDAIIISILIAFSIGFFSGFSTFLALYRTIYFMPFFLMGYFYNDINMTVRKFTKFRIFFISILILILFGIFFLSVNGYSSDIYYAYAPRFGYDGYNFSNVLLRLFGFISSSVICFLFLFIVPSKRYFFTKFGGNTLNAYVLHQFFIWPICRLIYEFNTNEYLIIIGGFFYSILLTYFLSHQKVSKILLYLTSFDKFKRLLFIKSDK